MAIESTGGRHWEVPDIRSLINFLSAPSLLMDATAEKIAAVVQAPKTGTIHKVYLRTGAVTTGDTLKVSFQGVDDTTGAPDAVIAQYRTIAIADANDNTELATGILTDDGTDTGVARSVTEGDEFAVVFEFNSWVAGNLNLSTQGMTVFLAYPYTLHFTTAWSKQLNQLALAFEYSDGTIVTPTVWPVIGAAQQWNNTSNPRERGTSILLPVGLRCVGVVGRIFASDSVIRLYDASDNVLRSVTCDQHKRESTATRNEFRRWAAIDLEAGTQYYLAIEPTSATNANYYRFVYASATQMEGCCDFGTTFKEVTRVAAGSGVWTTNTNRPFIGLAYEGLDDGASLGALALIYIPTFRPRRR